MAPKPLGLGAGDIMRKALLVVVGVLAAASAATSALAQGPADIAAAYRDGRVRDAIEAAEQGLARATTPGGAWAMSEILAETCINARSAACLRRNAKRLSDAGGGEARGARRFILLMALERHWSGDAQFMVARDGADFSLKYADPAADPVQAARFFILNAQQAQDGGDYLRARRHINRAFASWLRIESPYHRALLLKEMIKCAFAAQDTARGLKWLAAGQPLLKTLSGYDRADLLLLTADSLGAAGQLEDAVSAYGEAFTAISAVQLDRARKEALLSHVATGRASMLALMGDAAKASVEVEKSPFRVARNILVKQTALNADELEYVTFEIFFDRLAGNRPNWRWRGALEKTAEPGPEAAAYKRLALALIADDPAAARTLFNEAIAARFALLEKQRADTSAFALPSVLDRLLLGIGAQVWTGEEDGALLVRAMELWNRNARYAVSDALATMAAQRSDNERRAAHAVLRLTDRQHAWEVAQITASRPKKSWSAAFAARDFDHALVRTRLGMRPGAVGLPTLAELQGALQADEAFIGFIAGKKLCVRKTGLWSAAMLDETAQRPGEGLTPQQQLKIDLKLVLAGLTDQAAPSDARDSQFPVAAAMRLYKVLFGGLDGCLAGATAIQFFAPSDIAALPVSVLLKDAPPRMGNGYDLSRARWLVRDYAVAQVTSARDFLSARALSRRPGGPIAFAGMGDPRLGARLADGATGAGAILRRTGPVGEAALRELAELPDTAVELSNITRSIKGASTVLLAEQATEERFRALPLGQYQVLHFATHGLVRGEIEGLAQPALVFTPKDMSDELNDGLLTASDIANLDLTARLVVLSACNTANFDPALFNAQIQGLSSAFAVAGVPAAVASLWSVESQTSARLMTNLYRHLLGADAPGIAAALQRAIVDTIDGAPSRPYYHPRFWAPFIALGDGAAKVDAGHAAAPASVAVSDGGGEIISAAAAGNVVITSEIGPVTNGQLVSLLTARDQSHKTLWAQENSGIGAGFLRAFGGDVVVTGYRGDNRQDGAATRPLLRRVTVEGKPVWQVALDSKFDSAVVGALAVSGEAIFAVLMPMRQKAGSYAFEVVRLDASGKEQARVLQHRNVGGRLAASLMLSALVKGDALIVSASHGATDFDIQRDDFALSSICAKRAGTDFYRLDAASLAVRQQASANGLSVTALAQAKKHLLVTGSERIRCEIEDERPLLGELSDALAVTVLWRDDSVFAGKLVGVLSNAGGLTAVGQLHEPLNIREIREDAAGHALAPAQDEIFAVKNPAILNNRHSTTLVVEMDVRGAVRERRILSSGLAQYPLGVVATGGGGAVYGSAGYNPWLESLPR